MLTFFRKIRKSLLSKNLISKYLAYAIGEIALVVIGILIALQINNWNAEQQLRKKEKIYLKEILENLKSDLDDLHQTLKFNSKKDSTINKVIEVMLRSEENSEIGLFIANHMRTLAEYSVFTQNKVAFENMLSAENIDLISDKNLRMLLSAYYRERDLDDGTQERVKQLTRIFVDHISPMHMNKEGIERRLGFINDFPSVSDINFKNNQELLGNIFGMKMNLNAHYVYLLDFKNEIEELILQLEAYLE